MTDNYVENRRKYVAEVRKSFSDSEERSPSSNRYRFENEDEMDMEKKAEGIGAGIKMRLILSVMLFAAFLLCDLTNTSFGGFSSQEILDKIEENYDYTNLQKYVMIVENEFK